MPPCSEPVAAAATTIVMRDAPQGLQVLMVQRAPTLVFHGGAWVFPGGRVDESDRVGADEVGAARRAAVRETREEASLTTVPEELFAFSHWTTPAGRPRRFATWFFVTRVDSSLEATVDGTEIRAHRWLGIREALEAQRRGELELPPPTFVSLVSLVTCRDWAAVAELARSRPPPIFVPRPRVVADGVVSLYHGDAAYDGAPLDAPGRRHRLHMLKSGHRYEVA